MPATTSATRGAVVIARAPIDEDAATASDVGDSTDDGGDSEDGEFSEDGDADADEDRAGAPAAEKSAAAGAPKAKGMDAKMTSWNVRVREDTAKYLLNLDTESAFYDPKTRAMRENPFPDKRPGVDVVYAGDNVWKASGAVTSIAESQLFAWDAANHGQDVHLQANPTQAALLKQQFEERKAAVRELQRQRLVAKYGEDSGVAGGGADVGAGAGPGTGRSGTAPGGAAVAGPRALPIAGSSASAPLPEEVRRGATGGYDEYGADGRPLGSDDPAGPAPPRAASAAVRTRASALEEDVHPGSHSSVWGSFFDLESKRWGYACCRSLSHASECAASAKRARRE